MTSVLDRDALEGSPLADLHEIANQLGVESFRRLRKADLINAIVVKQGGEAAPKQEEAPDEDTPRPRRRRSRKSASDDETTAAVEAADRADEEEEPEPRRPRGRRRGGGGGGNGDKPAERERGDRDRGDRDRERPADEIIEGTVELQPNGSGFVRLNHPETSDGDVYVSAAQVKRCELVSGDKVGGPVRPPRRSERFPSLVRVDTINGKPADEVAGKEGARYEDVKSTFPTERLELTSGDATVDAVQWLVPFGKGSRVVVTGPALGGKSDLLRRIASALPSENLEVTVVLAGVRPEEAAEWGDNASGVFLGASSDQQVQVVEQAVELGRRVASRGGDAVVVIDAIDGLPPHAARRALAAARNIVDSGSLTIIAAAAAPLGGETTVIALDGTLTGLRRFPNLDLAASGTMRPELLVGDAGADKIAAARAEARAASA